MSKRTYNTRDDADHERVQTARKELAQLDAQSETVGSSQLAKLSDRARDHFTAADDDSGDPIEIWGKRIGRLLAVAVVGYLAIHLYQTYVMG